MLSHVTFDAEENKNEKHLMLHAIPFYNSRKKKELLETKKNMGKIVNTVILKEAYQPDKKNIR